MKLAEALQERADLNRKIQELRKRITNNVLVQDGEEPSENPEILIKELNDSAAKLEHLMFSINLTNCKTIVNGMSLTEIIAKKDILMLKISAYKDMIYVDGQKANRARGTEIKIKSLLKAPELQKTIDKLSKELRILDNLLQENNWKTELIEK
jgi:hypothetical protein